MSATAVLLAAAIASGIADGPHKRPTRSPQQFETLQDMFETQTDSWTALLMPTATAKASEETTRESLYKPVVRETLEIPQQAAQQLSGIVFGGVRITR
jgi:hypothetical protein